MLYELHQLYNDGKIDDPSDKLILENIINSKRKVVMEIELDGKEKTTVIIPIPVLLILLLPCLTEKKKERKG